jgi:hypothetical protein
MLNVLTIAFTFSSLVLVARQAVDVEWQLDNTIRVEDRDAILSLSKKMGIEQPRRISFGQFLPSLCRFVRVESSVVETGNQRTWFELLLRPPESWECLLPKPDAKSVGRWIALSSDLEKREEWRFRDKEWHIDIPLGPEVPYGDAELIVFTIRRGQLINRLPESKGPLNSSSKLPDIKADTITAIKKGSNGIRTYQVRTGQAGGFLLNVRIVGSGVELYWYGMWIV